MKAGAARRLRMPHVATQYRSVSALISRAWVNASQGIALEVVVSASHLAVAASAAAMVVDSRRCPKLGDILRILYGG